MMQIFSCGLSALKEMTASAETDAVLVKASSDTWFGYLTWVDLCCRKENNPHCYES